jgi:hypothetical protein
MEGGLIVKKRVIWSIISVLMLGFAGCGEEESDIPTASTPKIVKGLSGDTYMNTKFGIKISNLPVDEWTVKALGKDEQGWLMSPEGFTPIYWLLLMEPVPADQFVELDAERDLLPIIEAKIPFVSVFLDYDKGGSYETHDLAEELSWYAASYSAEIESKRFVSSGNATGIQAILVRTFGEGDLPGKEALTWFAKGEIEVRCEYIAKEPEFDEYLDVYMNVIQNILLMGK